MASREKGIIALGPHGFSRIAYEEWGDPSCARVLVCVHGLTRNRHDFDELAALLSDRWRVVCVDVPGRGDSDWLPIPADYDVPVYCQMLAQLLARLDVEEASWLGTSMGGIIGIALAAQPRSPIRQLVLNDVGGFIPKAALERIKSYATIVPRFTSLDDAEQWMRQSYQAFGPLTDRQWRYMAAHSIRDAGDGQGFRLHYDPALTQALAKFDPTDVNLWPLWDAVRCPVFVIRGANSDLLLPETLMEMQARGPGAEIAVIEGCGHAPSLMDPAQIALVRGWLEA
jgi:pimeloyl-ACP methyl ester carboxylesterase